MRRASRHDDNGNNRINLNNDPTILVRGGNSYARSPVCADARRACRCAHSFL